jgi:glycosyltransferase involved in cell wall biosynthesis
VEVIPPGIRTQNSWNTEYGDEDDISNIVTGEYILCSTAANFSPHKNMPVLLESFKIISKMHPSIKLVITGKKTKNKIKTINNFAADLFFEGKIILTGFVPAQKLYALYKKAIGCIIPSKYEGFGLPVIEAQSLGCPTLASNAGSLPEVMGDDAYIFDSSSPESLACLITKLIEDPVFRDRAARHGLDNALRFDPIQAAKKFIELCETVSNGSVRE